MGLKWGKSNILVDLVDKAADSETTSKKAEKSGPKELLFSENFACASCNISFAEISPRIFSFNSPYGACAECHGLGCTFEVDPALVVPDPKRSLEEGAIYPWSKTGNPYYEQLLASLAKHFKFKMDTPFEKLTKAQQGMLLYGSGEEKVRLAHNSFDGREFWEYRKSFEGVITNLKRRHEESQSDRTRADIENYMTQMTCEHCKGCRLRPESLAVRVGELSIAQVCGLSVYKAMDFFKDLNTHLTPRQQAIAHQVLIEIGSRLKFLFDVGLDYLTLDRQANTLSGGEAQRIRLATQIGSGLSGVLYVLDEPSVGLHQRDNNRLIGTLKRLRELGNTLLVVEHDEDTIRQADWIIDIGPGAGVHGGYVVAEGKIEAICAAKNSSTGAYISGRKKNSCACKTPSRQR